MTERWDIGRNLLLRVGLVAAIVVVYLIAVRPARIVFLEHVATPLFASGGAVEDGSIRLEPDLTVVTASGPGVDERGLNDSALFKTPLGDRPMLGVLVLAALYPRKRWWLVLAGTALLEGGLTTAFFAAGTNGVSGAFVAHRVTQAVLNDTIPLVLPALLFLLDRSGFLSGEVTEHDQTRGAGKASTSSDRSEHA